MGRRVACFLIVLGMCFFSPRDVAYPGTQSASISYQAVFSQADLVIDQIGGFDEIKLMSCVRSHETGLPDLPFRLVHLVIPEGSRAASVSVKAADEVNLGGNFLISPIQPDLKTDGTSGGQHVGPDPSVYGSDSFYPAHRVEIVGQGYLGGYPIVTLSVTPFRYLPKSGSLTFYPRLDIEVELEPDQKATSASLIPTRTPSAEQLYREVLSRVASNARDVAQLGLGSGSPAQSGIGPDIDQYYQYLIVTSPTLAQSFQPLADWKTKKGVRACVVSIDTILANYSGRDNAEKLRNFLLGAYGRGTVWVLLGGDEDVIPVRYAYPTNTSSVPSYPNQQICDLYFSDVDGQWDLDNDGVWGEPQQDSPDIYPDLFVGRIPVGDPAEADAFVEKLISYEKNPGGGTFDYLTRALWVSSDQMRDWDGGIGQHGLLAAGIPSSFSQDLISLIESPSGAAENPIGPDGVTCVNQMNQAWGIIGILAHGKSSGFVAKSNLTNGSPKSWVLTYAGDGDGQGHMTNLGNHGQYGIMYSIACSQGAIDVDKYPYMGGEPCMAEFYPLASQKGGVAFLGNTRWGWVGVSYLLFEEFIQNLFDENLNHHLGVAEALSRCAYPGYRDIDYGHNLFGDPEMQVWTQTPAALSVIHPEQVTLGKQSVALSVSSQGGGVDQARVCMTLRGKTIFLGQTDQNGGISCNLDLDDVGEMSLVVTKPNYVPYVDSVTITLAAGVDDDEADAGMLSFELGQNHPNPFNPVTSIQYTVDSRQTARSTSLRIYNVLGQRVRTLVNEEKKPGRYRVLWDGRDDQGSEVSSGIYFYILQNGEDRETKKRVLIR
jgi:hypothetical protein